MHRFDGWTLRPPARDGCAQRHTRSEPLAAGDHALPPVAESLSPGVLRRLP